MTSADTVYCLDTSAILFMADTYSADAFPDVWKRLAELAESEVVMAPREVRRELEKKEDNGALSWVKANTSLLRDLDADQSSVASDLVSSPRYRDLIDLDAEFPDADPFVVALAVTCQVRSVLFTEPPAVVGIKSFRSRVSISDVCEDADYRIRFLTPYQMLREIDIDVPEPGAEGLAGLYGIWRDVDFSEEEIGASKLKTRGIPL